MKHRLKMQQELQIDNFQEVDSIMKNILGYLQGTRSESGFLSFLYSGIKRTN